MPGTHYSAATGLILKMEVMVMRQVDVQQTPRISMRLRGHLLGMIVFLLCIAMLGCHHRQSCMRGPRALWAPDDSAFFPK